MYSRTSQSNKPHRKELKQGISAEESRKKREETSIEIRKSKREEGLQKKRNFGIVSDTPITDDSSPNADSIPHYANALHSNETDLQLEATIAFRKLLSIERNPPIDQVIQSGVVPRLVQFLTRTDNAKIQFEAAWALTNIASGSSEQTQMLVHDGGVPIFVQLLSSGDDELREQAVWALGNIAGDSPKCRDFVLLHGIMAPLLNILSQSRNKQTMFRNATWTLSNLCRGRPSPKFELIEPSIPVLSRLIFSSDQEVLIDACWALSYISDGSDSNIQAVIDAGIASRMVQLLNHSAYTVQTPALRTVGNIVTGNDHQTQVIIDLQALPMLHQLLQSPRKGIRKEACWTVSNITAGNQQQTQLVINANLMAPLIALLGSAEFDVKKEAAWALSNATTWKSPEQVRYLVGLGCIKPLCDLLALKDAKLIGVVLEALENILSVGDHVSKSQTGAGNPFVELIEEAEGLDKIEELQNHENEEIYKKALRILENFFNASEDDENMTPNITSNQQTFAFGGAVQTPNGGFNF